MSTADGDVVDNRYGAINEGVEDTYASINKPKNVEMKELPESNDKETNGVSSHPGNCHGTDPENGKQPSGSKPYMPKIIIAMVIVLIIAVVALSLVLYRLDQDVGKANTKTTNVESTLKKDIGQLNDKITKLEAKPQAPSLKANITLLKKQLAASAAKIVAVEGAQTKTGKEISNLDGKIIASAAKIVAVEGAQTKTGKEISNLDGKISANKDFAEQLHMYVQFGESRFKDLGLTFEKIVKLAGMENKVSEDNAILHKLLGQAQSFDKTYKAKWGIEYTDVLRLADGLDFKGPLQLLAKIDELCKLFTEEYKTTWNIEFKDLIRLTKKEDVKGIKVPKIAAEYINYVIQGIPPVLQKLEYMYDVFNKTYKEKWNIEFKDVIALTKEINFKVNDPKIPVLVMIGGWHVNNFLEMWGDSFEGFIHVLKERDEKERAAILAKIKAVVAADKLKFQPATFGYEEKLGTSISGYIQIKEDDEWGTISKDKFFDTQANVVCKYGGYTSGKYDKGKYNVGEITPNATHLIKWLQCFEGATVITECKAIKAGNDTWPITDNVGVKCNL